MSLEAKEEGCGQGSDCGPAAAPPARHSSKAEPLPVVLQLEVTTRRQAQILYISLALLMGGFLAFTIVLVSLRERLHGLSPYSPSQNPYYRAALAVACVCLAAILWLAALYGLRLRQVLRQRRHWSMRQKALALDAGGMLAIQILLSSFWMANYAAVLSSDCTWPTLTVATLSILHDTAFNLLLLWMCIQMHGMCVSRGHIAYIPTVRSYIAEAVQACFRVCSCRPVLEEGKGEDAAAAEGERAAGASGCSGEVGTAEDSSRRGEGEGQPSSQQGSSLGSGDLGSMRQDSRASNDSSRGSQSVGGPWAAGGAGGDRWNAAGGDSSSWARAGGGSDSWSEGGANNGTWCEGGSPGKRAQGVESMAGKSGHCSSTGTQALLIIDLPWREQFKTHLPKLILWAALEISTFLGTAGQLQGKDIFTAPSRGCRPEGVTCNISKLDSTGLTMHIAVVMCYVALYFFYMWRAHQDHKLLPYASYRMSNLYIRVQARYVTLVLLAVALDLILLGSMGVYSCWTFIHYQLGLPPMEISLVLMVAVSAFLYMPASSKGAPILQAWLSEFAWTQASLPAQKELRNAHLLDSMASNPSGLQLRRQLSLLPARVARQVQKALAPDAALDVPSLDTAEQLAREPMFCMELALRLFYWTRLAKVYGLDDPLVSESYALSLFGLQQCQCFLEPTTDSKMLVGWGGSTVVLAFRGTSSGTNALHDIQLWSTPHLPTRRWLGMVVRVHSGFYKSWTANGFDQRVLQKVEEIIEGSQVGAGALTLYLTGHSLGGALATLCAFELRKRWPEARLMVYTYGAPRVGNLAWATEYNRAVPETWAVINLQDPVPRVPKFTYYPSGHRVAMSRAGDLLVRPTYFEASVLSRSGGSVFNHRNGSYIASFAAVLKAQFVPGKALPGGAEGVAQLCQQLDLGKTLLLDHMDTDSLQNPALLPVPLVAKAAPKQKPGRTRRILSKARAAAVMLGSGRHRMAAQADDADAAEGQKMEGASSGLGAVPEDDGEAESKERAD